MLHAISCNPNYAEMGVYYYSNADDKCDLREFLDGLTPGNRQKALAWISMLEEKGPAPSPFVRGYSGRRNPRAEDKTFGKTGENTLLLYLSETYRPHSHFHEKTRRGSEE